MKNAVKIPLIILAVLLGVIILFLCGLKIAGLIMYGDFFRDAEREFRIPGLGDDLIPQGITYDSESGMFLLCGYMHDDTASRIYVIDAENKKSRFVTVKKSDGSDYTGHAGGMAVYEDYIYIANAGTIFVCRLADVLDAADGAAVTICGKIPVSCRASFNYVDGDTLYVGEFYREPGYETDESHHFTTGEGERNNALILAYKLSPDAEFGIVSGKPEYAYSVRDMVQGMCVTDSGSICLSVSWGPGSSYIYVYEGMDAYDADATLKTDGVEIPVRHLDGAHLKKTIKPEPMSEELTYVNGRVYTIYESASNKYIFGKLFRATHCWSFAEE